VTHCKEIVREKSGEEKKKVGRRVRGEGGKKVERERGEREREKERKRENLPPAC
jgi:hypothetical protein